MNIRKYLTAAAVAGAGLMATAPAQAALSFDFTGGDSDTPSGFCRFDFGSEHVGSEACALGGAFQPLVFDKGGITLTVLGQSGPIVEGKRQSAETILDDRPDNGGLGVVSEGSSSLEQVNVANRELLVLIFTDTITGDPIDVTLRNLEFNNGAHIDCPTDVSASEGGCGGLLAGVDGMSIGEFDFSLNNEGAQPGTDLVGNGILPSLGLGSKGSIFTLAARPDEVEPQAWYLGSFDVRVPAPAPLLLLGLGLLGLGATVRRRRG